MKYRFQKALLLLVAAALLLSSCQLTISGTRESGTTEADADRQTEGSGGEEKETEKEKTETGEFLSSLTNLSFRLFHGVLKDGENTLISPLSAELCLAMATVGAEGETLAELETLYGVSASELHSSFCEYSRDLLKEGKTANPLKIANSAWIKESYEEKIKEQYLQSIADWYQASVYTTPFDETTAPDINRWVSEKTDGMIPKLFDSLDKADFVTILINAIAFTAKWAEEYKETDVTQDIFYNNDGTEQTVKMMNSAEKFYLSGADGLEGGFVKSYENGRYAFVALLPEKDVDVNDFAKSLNGETWLKLWNNKKSRVTVKAQLPAFGYRTDMDLIPTLSDLGISQLFSGEGLTGVADERLVVSEIRQVAYIDVSEQGTKAAAVTEIGMKTTAYGPVSEIYSVILNRPFVYMIVDFDTGMPIFIGTVSNL